MDKNVKQRTTKLRELAFSLTPLHHTATEKHNNQRGPKPQSTEDERS